MARKTATVLIEDAGRDQGKTFLIREMSAHRAERWATRALMALAKAGVQVPDDLAGAGLAGIAAMPHVGDVRQKGMMVGIEIVADRSSKAPFPPARQVGARVCRHARSLGFLLRPLGDVIVVMPPLSITVEELDGLMDGLEVSIRKILDETEASR